MPAQKADNPGDYSGNFTIGSLTGDWVGPATCLDDYPDTQPPIPYGPANANQDLSLLVEEGFKPVRGLLTEGRYLTLEMAGLALTNPNGRSVGVSLATATHDDVRQRWVVHVVDGPAYSYTFYLQSAADGTYIAGLPLLGGLTTDVAGTQAFTVSYQAGGSTYTISLEGKAGSFLGLAPASRGLLGEIAVAIEREGLLGFGGFKLYSVSYHIFPDQSGQSGWRQRLSSPWHF